MQTRLRHFKHKYLKAIEDMLGRLQVPHVVLSANFVEGLWYVHFLLQKDDESQNVTVEIAEKTKSF